MKFKKGDEVILKCKCHYDVKAVIIKCCEPDVVKVELEKYKIEMYCNVDSLVLLEEFVDLSEDMFKI